MNFDHFLDCFGDCLRQKLSIQTGFYSVRLGRMHGRKVYHSLQLLIQIEIPRKNWLVVTIVVKLFISSLLDSYDNPP